MAEADEKPEQDAGAEPTEEELRAQVTAKDTEFKELRTQFDVAGGRIVGVRQRREKDVMPARGDSDIGLVSVSAQAAMVDLPAVATTANAVLASNSPFRM